MFRNLFFTAPVAQSKVLACTLAIGCWLVPAPATSAQEFVSAANPVPSAYQSPRAGKGGTSLKSILAGLENQFNVRFVYESSLVDRKQLSYDGTREGKSLEQLLDELLAATKLSYRKLDAHTYGIVRKSHKISSLRPHGAGPEAAAGPGISLDRFASANPLEKAGPGGEERALTITGRVTDAGGESVVGANVLLKGTTTGATTNADGNYSIAVPDDQANATLVFSFIGYLTEEVPINNRTTINVALVPDVQSLNEVVVTALGIKREEKALGYAVSTITSEQITQAGNTNFASALYGKAAGVKITTAPGGASSAVNVQIRGINSLNYNQQPLYVVDGIMIRNDGQNGAAGANNGNYWDDQRIRGNGILDINPADIASLTVLKGASATALYGSDAASGVIVITTKKGTKGKGLGVDVNYTATVEQVAFLPKFQNVYGPGYDRGTNVSAGADAAGWIPDANSPGGLRPYFRAYGQFGPRMEGQPVRWWDGSTRDFSPREDNYRDIFDRGYNSNFNIGLSNQTDKISYRLSATRMDYKGTNPGSNQERNSFNLNSTVQLSNKVSTDVVVNFINTQTHNRAYQLGQVLGSFGGFFSRTEDVGLMRDRFRTTDGYKYSTLGSGRPEDFVYNIRATNLLDFFWNQLKNDYDETENRLITSATLNWDIVDHLRFRGRVGNDYTGLNIEDRRYNEYATAYNSSSNSSGGYNTSKGQYSILYGDALLTYSNQVGEEFDFSLSGGFQSRSENYRDQSSGTTGGLVTENWFSLSNSYGIPTTSSGRKELLKYAYLGIVNLGFRDFLFLEGTARQEYASTLPPVNNSYFYPSVNASFVFTDAFRLPAALSFGKLRASYGVVATIPPVYESNILYSQTPLQTPTGSVPSLSLTGPYGNNTLRPEKKYEKEFGLETRFLNNRLGLNVAFYDNVINDQILNLSTAPSNGATSQIVNVGKIGSRGVEIALNATPISVGDFRWDARVNYAFNRSRVISLADGVKEIIFNESEQSAVRVVAGVGETLGNIYVYPRATDENGNLLISDDGFYVMDKTRYVRAGNIMPKAVGGLSNTFSYGGFSLDFTVDYRFGGQMVSNPTKYQTGAGLYENTLQYRDAENGGLEYTENGVTYNDGVLLEGVNQNSGEPNNRIISAADYYLTTFGWGYDAWNEKGSVFDNSFVKMREATLSYRVPAAFASKLRLNNIRFSLVGRNLFYFWRTLENLDPEAPIGNKWWSQGIDVGSSAATRSFGVALHASF